MYSSKTLLLHALVFATLPLCAQSSLSASRTQDCSHLIVNRSYSQTFQGFLNVPVYLASFGAPSPEGVGIVPNAGTGYLTFLPHGKISGRVTLAIGLLGLIQDMLPDDTSQYAVTWDTAKQPPVCVGSLTLNVAGEAPFNFQLLVTGGGNQIEMIHTDTGLIVSVTGYPVRTFGCSNGTVHGTYSTDTRGWLLSPPSGPMHLPPEQLLGGYAPFAFSGALHFNSHMNPPANEFPGLPDGARAITAWETASMNGQIVPRTEHGWYKINRDCSGTMVLRDDQGDPDTHFEMFVGEDANSIHMVDIDADAKTGVPLLVLGASATRERGSQQQ